MSSLFEIKGQVVVLTGATGVLVGEAARYLARQGAVVALLARNEEKLAAAVDALEAEGCQASAHVADVLDSAALERARDAILARHGRIDALLNGAGGNMPGATVTPEQSIFDLKVEDYDRVMDLNLKGTLLPSLVFGQTMAVQGAGSIINFSSMASDRAITRVLGYSNAKAAVDNLTRWMATEFARRHGDKLRVNAIAPGFFVADQNRRLLLNPDGSLTDRGNKIVANTPMGRFGYAAEICGALHYLLAPASAFVTGQVIAIDGGFSIFSGV